MATTYNNLYLDIRQQLRRAGIEEATLEARELVCFGTNKSREELARDGGLYASPELEHRVRDLVRRHLEGEPVELRHKELFLLAVATSIDALAVGVSFSMVELSVSIGAAAALIGCTPFAISVGGVFVGHIFGARYKNRAEFVGGAILILIGVKILLEHFGVL